MKKLVTLFLFFLAIQNFYSQEWELVATSKDGDKYFMKREKINSYGNPKVWVMSIVKSVIYRKDNKENKLYNAKILDLMEYDCSSKNYRLLETIYYNSNGQVVKHDKWQEIDEWQIVIPDTIAETELNFVCNNIK